jgi:hypothetical protein
MRCWFLNFLGCLVEEEKNKNIKIFALHASIKIFTNLKDWSGSRIIVSVPAASFSVIGQFFAVSTPNCMQEKSALMYNVHVQGNFRYEISGLQTGSCKCFLYQSL